MKKYTIEVKVDTNDADYVSKVSGIDEKELETIKPLLEAIKNFKPYSTPCSWSTSGTEHQSNFPYGECCREDMGEKPVDELYKEYGEDAMEIFLDLCPSVEYGFHTIEDVRICESTPWVKLV